MNLRLARFISPVALSALVACGHFSNGPDAGIDAAVQPGSDGGVDAGLPPSDPFATKVISFNPGVGAGFGQSKFPQVVLGGPEGGGEGFGSLDVLSLGNGGSIVLGFNDAILIDRPGVDLLVFENAFVGFPETGFVAVSEDGIDWHQWPCAADDPDGGYPGCAGVHPVFASTASGISATDPRVAGGDGFDLAALGMSRARFVRVRDSGKNSYAPPGGGFDLDAVAIVHGQRLDGGPL